MHEEYEILDVSGDVGLRVKGDSLESLFVAAAKGLYSLITEPERINPSDERRINVYCERLDDLLIGWLNELIFQFDTYGFVGRDIQIEKLTENRIEAVVKGERFDPERHTKGLLLKAATYHDLKLQKQDGLWVAEVVFDI